MLRPSSLEPGDWIGIVAPGRKVSYPHIEAALNTFASWGLEVELAPNLVSNDHSYLASTDANRAGDFQRMLDDERIKAIVCARGGYGTTRILDQLDFSSFKRSPKWIVGFSDITALHLKIFSLGIESIHGIMPILFDKPEYASSIVSLQKVMFGLDTSLTTGPSKFNKSGSATGQVLGGNLSLIVDSLGTSTELDLDGKLLILEEIDEYLYKTDRMVTQLHRAGKLEKLGGLIIGHMTALKEGELPFGETVEKIILNKVGRLDFPIAFGFPIGHNSPNLAWRHGSVMILTVDENHSSLSPI